VIKSIRASIKSTLTYWAHKPNSFLAEAGAVPRRQLNAAFRTLVSRDTNNEILKKTKVPGKLPENKKSQYMEDEYIVELSLLYG